MIILLLTGLPGSFIPKTKPIVGLDKVVHMLMYFGFIYLTLWGYRKPYRENGKNYRNKAIGITLAIGIVYGVLTEIMQETLIPGRVGSVYDWIADTIGCLLGATFFYFFNRNGNKLKNETLDK